MKGISEWIWLIGGIMAAVIIFTIASMQIQNTIKATIEKNSIQKFSEVVSIINNLCWSFEGNTREYTLQLGETIDGIYASPLPYERYESEQLTNKIINEEKSSGNNLCLKIKNKKLTCEKLDCNSTFPFVGAVPEKFSLSGMVSKWMGKGSIFNYYLGFERKIGAVEVSLNETSKEVLE